MDRHHRSSEDGPMPNRRVFTAITVTSGAVAIISFPALQRWLGDLIGAVLGLADRVMMTLADVNPTILYITAAVLTALEASLLVGLLLPGDLVVLFLGTTVTSPSAFMLSVTVVALGSMIGEAIGYGLGRRYGEGIQRGRIGRLVGVRRWERARSFFGSRRGSSVVFGARFLAGVHAVVPIMAGSLEMRFRSFLSWAGAGAVTWALIYITAGAAAGVPARQAEAPMATVGVALMVVMAVAGAISLLVARRGR